MTTTECPAATSRSSAATSFATSAKCRPVVGSSNRNSVRRLPRRPFRRPAARLDELGRELQPLRLAARQRRHGLPERQVLEPDVDERLQALAHGVVAAKYSSASATVMSSTSAIDFGRARPSASCTSSTSLR